MTLLGTNARVAVSAALVLRNAIAVVKILVCIICQPTRSKLLRSVSGYLKACCCAKAHIFLLIVDGVVVVDDVAIPVLDKVCLPTLPRARPYDERGMLKMW